MIFNASRFSAQERFLSPSKTATRLLKFFNKLFLKNLLTFLSVCDIILMRLRKAPNQQGLLVKRLRRRPLTAETGVRFPYGSPNESKVYKTLLFVFLSPIWFSLKNARGYPIHNQASDRSQCVFYILLLNPSHQEISNILNQLSFPFTHSSDFSLQRFRSALKFNISLLA